MFVFFLLNKKTYSEPYQTSMIELFFANSLRLKAVDYFRKKVYRRFYSGFQIQVTSGLCRNAMVSEIYNQGHIQNI